MWIRGRIFGISLMASIAWHLLWICGPSVVLVPDKVEQRKFPVITFLGPILEETAFRRGLAKASEFIEIPARKSLISDEPTLEIKLPEYRISREKDKYRLGRKELTRSQEPYLLVKEVPRPIPSELKANSIPIPFKIEGPVRDRVVANRPSLPALPEWAKARTLKFAMKLKFWVSPEGIVGEVEPQVSSGYPEIDLLGMRYMYKWRFQPLPSTVDQARQWGVISLKLK